MRVFVSSPATLTEAQASTRCAVLHELHHRQMETFSVDRDQYAALPWQQLRSTVSGADGAVIFGFRQLHVARGEWRPETAEARPPADWYPTPWTQIEAGLAIMAHVPVLVVADTEVTDGVFAPDLWGESVFGLRIGKAPAARSEVFDAWAAAVSDRALQRTSR